MQLEYHVIAASGDYEDYGEHIMYIFRDKDKAIGKKEDLEEEQKQDREKFNKKYDELQEKLYKKYKIESKELEDLYEVINDEDYEELSNLGWECDGLNEELPECARYLVDEYGVDENGKVVKYGRLYETDRGFKNFYDFESNGDEEEE